MFTLMVEVVNTAERNKKKSGKPDQLSREDRVLLALEYQRVRGFLYQRDYPMYLRLSGNWGVHGVPRNAFRTVLRTC